MPGSKKPQSLCPTLTVASKPWTLSSSDLPKVLRLGLGTLSEASYKGASLGVHDSLEKCQVLSPGP